MANETWYRVSNWRTDITPVTVLGHTAKTILMEYTNWNKQKYTRRQNIASSYDSYFKTWEEARQFLLERERRGREIAAASEKKHADNIARILDLQPPTETDEQRAER